MRRGRRCTGCRLHRKPLRCPWCRSHRAAKAIKVMIVDVGAKVDAARAHSPHLPSSHQHAILIFPFSPLLGSYSISLCFLNAPRHARRTTESANHPRPWNGFVLQLTRSPYWMRTNATCGGACPCRDGVRPSCWAMPIRPPSCPGPAAPWVSAHSWPRLHP